MSRRDPLVHCPICDRSLSKKTAHRCAKTVYSAIDAANTRAGDDTYELRIADPSSRPFSERVAHGFAMLQDDEHDDSRPYMSRGWWTQRRELEASHR